MGAGRHGDMRHLLRRYPYPHRAALALAPDCDGLTLERLRMLQSFWRSIRLDVAASFFAFSENPEAPPQASWFGGDAEGILEAFREGWIDTMHGLGDFAPDRRPTRAHARRALDEFVRRGLRVKAWSNHGGPHHSDNLVLHSARGDVADDGDESPYVSDLLCRYGIRFIWGSELTHVVGQDRPCTGREYFRDYPGRAPWRRLLALGAHALRLPGLVRRLDFEPFEDNRLLRPVTLRDGRRAYVFRRYGFWRKDTFDALPELLAPGVLDLLVQCEGALILYMHVGPPPWETPGDLERGFEACRALARRQESGDLWVARTVRLLEYVALRDGLRGEARCVGGRWFYDLGGVEDGVSGPYRPAPQELEGITLYTEDSLRTEVRLEGVGRLAFRANAPDHTGRASVTLTGL